MYYRRRKSNKHHSGIFPFLSIFIVLLFFGIGIQFSSILFVFLGIFLIKSLIHGLKSKNSRSSMPSRGGTQIPVNYTDTLEAHEDPDNYTRDLAFCFECGSKIDSIAKFCNFCGTNLIF